MGREDPQPLSAPARNGGCPAAQDGPSTAGVLVTADPRLERLDDYQILREIGRGGMGIVYEAVQVSLGQHVAMKVLPQHALLDHRHLLRFQREAKAAARLHHTNIVPVYGVGEENGLHCNSPSLGFEARSPISCPTRAQANSIRTQHGIPSKG
jgi:serine/threonine protein kinase